MREASFGFKEQAMLKALLHRFHQSEELLRFLPAQSAQQIQAQKSAAAVDFPAMLSMTQWMEMVHFSWFAPLLKTMPESSIPLFLSLFPSKQAKGLSQLLGVQPLSTQPTLFTKLFLSNLLEQRLRPENILPQELIADSPLLKISLVRLIHLVDFLGLFDLAAEFKQIVDKELITKIHGALKEDHLRFLNYCSKQPMKWIPPKLGLTAWNGDKKTLETLLHKRGLIRLAKALASEEASLRWYVIHRFDTSRSKVLTDTLKTPTDSALGPYFQAQVFDILGRLT